MNRPLPSISFFTLLFFVHLPVSYAQNDANIRQCYESFSCGNIENLVFPFWREGSPEFCRIEGFRLTKCDDDQPYINIGGTEFRLVSVDQPGFRITIAREDLWETICISPPITNLTLGNHLLRFSPANRNLTFFYGCGSSVAPPRDRARFECSAGSFSLYADDVNDGNSYQQFRQLCPGGAIHVQVNQSDFERHQIQRGGNFETGTWRVGFDVEYDYAEIFCGKCNGDKSLCNNPTSSQYPVCPKPGGGFNLRRKLIIGICAAAAAILLSCISIVCFRRRRTPTFLGKFTNKDQDIEAFLRNNGTLAPKRYTYSDIKRMTNSFKEKLGKGGFGCVYKGKLPNNHLVAVKVLNTSKGDGRDFINEVASISRTSHVNIVTLLGFCLEDDEFCPKISDFGLAKLCGRTDSIVSMMEARGTIGYIAPEVFCRNIGSVSHKSDVYSYGMMILEMAGGRKNLDVGVHETSEIYFPHWIHRNLEQDNIGPEMLGLLSKEEAEIARKMIIVGLWCIQTNPKDRPSISKVKDMLETKEALKIPPKP
ncbi:hypothetical protein V6N13_097274 [Hibiscus sabdariffa]|uniref:Protein kinase domain-containing protein n=1 Tax=Hibiscus sabdariffa TaxID=183260 RepID=A0ABR2AAS6_9ROSI